MRTAEWAQTTELTHEIFNIVKINMGILCLNNLFHNLYLFDLKFLNITYFVNHFKYNFIDNFNYSDIYLKIWLVITRDLER